MKFATELLKAYPTKVARKRATQILVNEKNPDTIVPEIAANIRTIPGIISQRGCTYAGCKGVVLGPTRDIVNITHGPIGCGFYSWLTRRNQTRPPTAEDDNFMTYCFSTDMKEEDIVFGGVKRLRTAIQEAYDIFHPKAIAVFSTCPVGLDRRRRSRRRAGNEGKARHQRLRLQLRRLSRRQPVGRPPHRQQRPVQARDRPGRHAARPASSTSACWASTTSAATPSCSKTCSSAAGSIWWPRSAATRRWSKFENAHMADLNCVMCHRSINYVADMIEKRFGVPWFKVNFIGAGGTAKSLRKIARYFEDQELIDRTEAVIAEEMAKVETVRAEVRSRCEGKRAMLFVGGSRAHHYQDLFSEIGMETIAAGYEFAHRDDYEGRRVLPTIKVDADSRNIEELHVDPDPERYRPRRSDEERRRLEAAGMTFNDYEGMMPEMAGRPAGDRRHQPLRNRAAVGNLPAGRVLRRDQGEVRRAEDGHPQQATAQLRLRRSLCRFPGSHQLLSRDRPSGQHAHLVVHHAAVGKGAGGPRSTPPYVRP